MERHPGGGGADDAASEEVPSTYFEAMAAQQEEGQEQGGQREQGAALFRFEDVFVGACVAWLVCLCVCMFKALWRFGAPLKYRSDSIHLLKPGELIARLPSTDTDTDTALSCVRYVDLPFLFRHLNASDPTTSASSASGDDDAEEEKKGGKGGGHGKSSSLPSADDDDKAEKKGKGKGKGKGKAKEESSSRHGHKRCVPTGGGVMSGLSVRPSSCLFPNPNPNPTSQTNSPARRRLGEVEPFAPPSPPSNPIDVDIDITHLCPSRAAEIMAINADVADHACVALHGVTAAGMGALHREHEEQGVMRWVG